METFKQRLPQKRVLSVGGSPRKKGNSDTLLTQNRKAIVIGVAEQVNKEDMGFTIEAMKMSLTALGYEIVGELAVYGIFDRGKVKNNIEVMNKAKALGKKLAQAIT